MASKLKPVRRPSPPRPDSEDTFKRKLEEIKNLRRQQNGGQEQGKTAKRKIIVNGKPALEVQGDWALFSSSTGKLYYFNLKTLVNQWTKPPEWTSPDSDATAPPAPPTLPPPPPPPMDPPPPEPAKAKKGFKMKMKKAKVKKKIAAPAVNPEDKIPKAYLPDLESPDHKLSRLDASSNSSRESSRSRSASPEVTEPVPEPTIINTGLQTALLAAKAKIESQVALLPQPTAPVTVPAASYLNNPTWMTEYNFPATLSRCKFPIIQDVLHELNTNRSKKRNLPNLPPLPANILALTEAGDAGSELEARRQIFFAELKTQYKNQLLSEKLSGLPVYKIPDDIWDKNYVLFMVELLGPSIKLEARPHGFTGDNVPVYTRTGKVALKMPFPEDIVRCHSVLQAWGTQTCHCVYANKTFTIERDDKQWRKDLEECKKFLIENGY